MNQERSFVEDSLEAQRADKIRLRLELLAMPPAIAQNLVSVIPRGARVHISSPHFSKSVFRSKKRVRV